MAVCRYHPDRPGIGVCMRCRAIICTACSTRVDGVNHCHACLKVLAQPEARSRSSRLAAVPLALAALSVAGLFFFGVAWLLQGRLAP